METRLASRSQRRAFADTFCRIFSHLTQGKPRSQKACAVVLYEKEHVSLFTPRRECIVLEKKACAVFHRFCFKKNASSFPRRECLVQGRLALLSERMRYSHKACSCSRKALFVLSVVSFGKDTPVPKWLH